MEILKRNNINILLEKAPKTPRTSFDIFFKMMKPEKYFGLAFLFSRLLLQGTKNYSASELALEFEKECIEISIKAKRDYFKISMEFLNEDFKKALELLREILLNSTFEELEKEVVKVKGELVSDLDDARAKLMDTYSGNVFKDHHYGCSNTKILENIDKITKKDIEEIKEELFKSPSAVVLVGDFKDEEKLLDEITSNLDFLKETKETIKIDEIEKISTDFRKEDEFIWISKNDAKQAQIMQGCILESYDSPKCAIYTLLNEIYGSLGLSSRLFVNLRDKQGLAYAVRSRYEKFSKCALFSMYIGTSPKNIQKCIDGFKEELQKIVDTPVLEEELEGAKKSLSGKLKHCSQTNAQNSDIAGYDYITGLGLGHSEKFLKEIYKVNAKDISKAAKEIIEKPKLLVIIAPDEYKINP